MPSRKKKDMKRKKQLSAEITMLMMGKLPSDERIQLEADLAVRNQTQSKLDNTLNDVSKTGLYTIYVLHNTGCVLLPVCEHFAIAYTHVCSSTHSGPVTNALRGLPGRPRGTKSHKAKEPMVVPAIVIRKYKQLLTTFDKTQPLGKSTFVMQHGLGKAYRPDDVATCTIHIVDPGAVYGIDTPCPVCGFKAKTIAQSWISKPRVAMGISSTEYFAGKRYQCQTCRLTFRSYMPKVMQKWMNHTTKARFAIASPVIVTHKNALSTDAYDLMRTLIGGTTVSVDKCASVFREMHGRTESRRCLCAMLHEEEYTRGGLHTGKRKHFQAADVGMVRPPGKTFWRDTAVRTLAVNEEYRLLFNEQVKCNVYACVSVLCVRACAYNIVHA